MNGLNNRLVVAATTTFVAIAYLVGLGSQPVFPAWAMYTSTEWAATFPGFSWILAAVVGLIEAVLYAAPGSALFVAVYNPSPGALRQREMK